ncbi:MAG: SpoIID/LytB domain-containing protein, partial [Myxococcota bacterium]
RTASSEEVWGEGLSYLESRAVENEDDSPDTYWQAALSRTTLRRALEALGRPVGKIKDLEVTQRSKSGRVLEIRVEGSEHEVELTGRDLRQALGGSTLKSTLFEIRRTDEGFVIAGSGRGHGVGMSQWGARAMASRGATYQEILEHFFPGTHLERIALEESSDISKAAARDGGAR